MLTTSLAGSETKYVWLQARVLKSGNLHIQGPGKIVNREYGMSTTIDYYKFGIELMEYFKKLEHLIFSYSKDSKKIYFPLQATFYNGGVDIHFQIKSQFSLGKEYGTSFTIKTEKLPLDLIKFLKLELNS
jgi:hypothetical protein